MKTVTTGTPHPDDDPVLLKRLEEQHRRLGTRNPACSSQDCKETNPFTMVGCHPDIWCYEHQLLNMGKHPYESHHQAGQHNSDVEADVPGNDHRVISELQAHWPEDTLRNPEQSPLLAAAAAIRGWMDVLRIILDRSVGWIPEFLEWLHVVLVDLFGGDWWTRLGWEPPDGS